MKLALLELRRRPWRFAPAVLALVLLVPALARADSFAAGSYVLPSDTTLQNDGGLEVYGLLYQLLLDGVEVKWAIQPGKAQAAPTSPPRWSTGPAARR